MSNDFAITSITSIGTLFCFMVLLWACRLGFKSSSPYYSWQKGLLVLECFEDLHCPQYRLCSQCIVRITLPTVTSRISLPSSLQDLSRRTIYSLSPGLRLNVTPATLTRKIQQSSPTPFSL